VLSVVRSVILRRIVAPFRFGAAMHRIPPIVAAVVLSAALAGCGSNKTVFDNRSSANTIKSFMDYVGKTRDMLLSDDDDDQEDGLEIVTNSLEKLRDEGDYLFPLQLLGDFVTGFGAKEPRKLDRGLQKKAFKSIVKEVDNSKRTVGQREFAIEQLGRIASAERLNDSDWAEDAVDALFGQVKGKEPVLIEAALVALEPVVVRGDSDWKSAAKTAGKALAKRLDDSDPEISRFAINSSVRALSRAQNSTGPVEELFHALENALGDVESPALQSELRLRVANLIKRQQAGVFSDELVKLRNALAKYSAARKISKDSYQSSLKSMRSEEDADDLDEYLARVEAEVKERKVLPNGAMTALAGLSNDTKAPTHKLRALTDTIFILAVDARTVPAYRSAAKIFSDLVKTHQGTDRAAVAAAQLGRLLAATDRADLIGPVLQETRELALSNLPFWIQRRLVTDLFVTAGDAIEPAVRLGAFQQLAVVGSTSGSWGLRLDVLARMQQLARLAGQPDVREAAAKWN
jgi:hypothetical protein